jgi:hypothetical protein
MLVLGRTANGQDRIFQFHDWHASPPAGAVDFGPEIPHIEDSSVGAGRDLV